MKHFYGDFQNDSAYIHRARTLTEWFRKDENDVNHMPRPLQ